jgi:hypothetical protein
MGLRGGSRVKTRERCEEREEEDEEENVEEDTSNKIQDTDSEVMRSGLVFQCSSVPASQTRRAGISDRYRLGER